MLINHNFYTNKLSNIISGQCLSFEANTETAPILSYRESIEIKKTLIQATASSTGLLADFSILPNQWESDVTIDGNNYKLLSMLKSWSKNSSGDSYRDSRIFVTSQPISKDECNCLIFHGYTWHDYNHGSSDLTNNVYVKLTSNPLDDVPSNTEYDFNGWNRIASSTRSGECSAIVPIDTESDSIYINIGLYHGTEVDAYTVWFGIKDLYLARIDYI